MNAISFHLGQTISELGRPRYLGDPRCELRVQQLSYKAVVWGMELPPTLWLPRPGQVQCLDHFYLTSEAHWILPTLLIVKSKLTPTKVRIFVTLRTQWQANNHLSKWIILAGMSWRERGQYWGVASALRLPPLYKGPIGKVISHRDSQLKEVISAMEAQRQRLDGFPYRLLVWVCTKDANLCTVQYERPERMSVLSTYCL